MSWFPKPETHSEGQRGLMVWLLFGAGVVCTLFAVCTLLIVWLGDWPAELAAQRLSAVSWALLGGMMGMGAVIVSLAIGGPVGRFRGKAFGAEFEADGDPVEVTVTNKPSNPVPTDAQ